MDKRGPLLESIAFWNCGVAPGGVNKSKKKTERRRNVAYQVLPRLTQEVGLLGLCEVDQCLLGAIENELLSGLTIRKYVHESWDLAIISDPSRWNLLDDGTPLIARWGDRSYRAGYRTQLEHVPTGTTIFLYLAHWPSRLFDQNGTARQKCAATIHMSLSEILTDESGMRVIVMGDFNDEPFDASLGVLPIARDQACARSNMLFNPFWRYLGHETPDTPIWGTTRYSTPETCWRTVDQILVSNHFLDTNGPLRYQSAGPMALSDAGFKPTTGDHLPVYFHLAPNGPVGRFW